MAVLGERVLHHRGERLRLAAARDDLAADRVVRVLRVDEADEVRRDVDPELVRRRQTLALVVGQLEDLLDLGEVVDPVAELPAPVVPLGVGDVLPDRSAAADGRCARPARAARAGSARLTNGISAALRAASWWATAVLISWASTLAGLRFRASGRAGDARQTHKVYAVCKSADDSAGPSVRSSTRWSRRHRRGVGATRRAEAGPSGGRDAGPPRTSLQQAGSLDLGLRSERSRLRDRPRLPVDDPVRGDAPERGRRLEPRAAGAGDRDHRSPGPTCGPTTGLPSGRIG